MKMMTKVMLRMQAVKKFKKNDKKIYTGTNTEDNEEENEHEQRKSGVIENEQNTYRRDTYESRTNKSQVSNGQSDSDEEKHDELVTRKGPNDDMLKKRNGKPSLNDDDNKENVDNNDNKDDNEKHHHMSTNRTHVTIDMDADYNNGNSNIEDQVETSEVQNKPSNQSMDNEDFGQAQMSSILQNDNAKNNDNKSDKNQIENDQKK